MRCFWKITGISNNIRAKPDAIPFKGIIDIPEAFRSRKAQHKELTARKYRTPKLETERSTY
jgi:hypothetical protein